MKSTRFVVVALVLLLALLAIKGKSGVYADQEIPTSFNGPDIRTIPGWHAVRYFWKYFSERSTVYPLESLRVPREFPSPFNIDDESGMLTQWGSGVDVLSYNSNPDHPDRNNWQSSILRRDNCSSTSRPRYIAWEYTDETLGVPASGIPKNMDLPRNREWFEQELVRMLRDVVMQCESRYVTLDHKAVFYLWCVHCFTGDLGSLLEKMRVKYPVAFIGGINLLYSQFWHDEPELARNIQALDGFMEYSLFPSAATPAEIAKGEIAYSGMMDMHVANTGKLLQTIWAWDNDKNKKVVKRKRYLGSTMSFCFNDGNVYPPRGNLSMCPQNIEEAKRYAQRLVDGKVAGIYAFGPLVPWDEFFEGGAVFPSQCTAETLDRPGRWIGCGLARLMVMWQYFRPPGLSFPGLTYR